ncbi:RagB/SusD family nutrient uptake outer membrane protein [Puteibacter caeruleilacunae]|nr:RagB/SusD family nutrient uptake outer membrane protein [Puteibacter caeruleilacunae]
MMKKLLYLLLAGLVLSSCSDFLDRAPKDAFSTSTYPASEKDVKMLAIGCYDGWVNTNWILEGDAASDNFYDGFPWEGWSAIQDGSMSASNTGNAGGLYKSSYEIINRCNNFMKVSADIEFADSDTKAALEGEVRFIRAWRYFVLTMGWGDVPLFQETFASVEDAIIAKSPASEVVKFVNDELDAIIPVLPVNTEKGRISKGAALALKMRLNLFKGNYDVAADAARDIEKLNKYDLFTDGDNAYSNLFTKEFEGNIETILAYQQLESNYSGWIVNLMPNGDGGWSSIAPLQGLVDAYETTNGLTIDEDPEYDEVHPWKDRDPRLKATILYTGRTWKNMAGLERVYNAVDKNLADGSANPDYRTNANNATKTGYNFIKWNPDLTKVSDAWNTGFDIYAFRFAEVLLSKAEALIEQNQITDEMYEAIDKVRTRAGMPMVDRTKYSSQASLRELIRRERRVEFAGEGLRRWDIIRWDIAKDVLNGDIKACVGTLDNPENPIEELRATMEDPVRITENKFADKNKLYPFPQTYLDMNSALKQNTGY